MKETYDLDRALLIELRKETGAKTLSEAMEIAARAYLELLRKKIVQKPQ
jgi:hypothetical protein